MKQKSPKKDEKTILQQQSSWNPYAIFQSQESNKMLSQLCILDHIYFSAVYKNGLGQGNVQMPGGAEGISRSWSVFSIFLITQIRVSWPYLPPIKAPQGSLGFLRVPHGSLWFLRVLRVYSFQITWPYWASQTKGSSVLLKLQEKHSPKKNDEM